MSNSRWRERVEVEGEGALKRAVGGTALWVMAKLFRGLPARRRRGGACAQTLKHRRCLPLGAMCAAAGLGVTWVPHLLILLIPPSAPQAIEAAFWGPRGVILIPRGDWFYQVKTQLQFLCPVISGVFNFNSWQQESQHYPRERVGGDFVRRLRRRRG